MKIACTKCGVENELGRVFCKGCGQKLDLTQNTSATDMKDRSKAPVGKTLMKTIVGLAALAVIASIALVLWPTIPGGEKADVRGASRVTRGIQGVKDGLQNGQAVAVSFSEKDVNAYLAREAPLRGMASAIVKFTPGQFDVYAVYEIALPFTIPLFEVDRIPYSCGVTGHFVNGQWQFLGRRGHLPLPGALGVPVRNQFAAVFDTFAKDQELIAAIQGAETKFDFGTVEIVFQK